MGEDGGVMVETILATALTASVSAIVGALVAALVSRAGKAATDTVDEAKSMQEGIRALLWRELKNIHAEASERGGMDIEERRHLENVYSAYHGIGGNGTGTRLFQESMEMPVID